MKRERFSGIGTILTSALAAVCCIGPAIAIVTGVSVGFLGGFMVLDPFRPYFLGAAALMLGYSFYRLYMKKTECACEADGRARRISRGIFWTGAMLFIVAASYQQVISRVYG